MYELPKTRTLVITSKYRNGYLGGKGKTRTIREKSEKWSLVEYERKFSLCSLNCSTETKFGEEAS